MFWNIMNHCFFLIKILTFLQFGWKTCKFVKNGILLPHHEKMYFEKNICVFKVGYLLYELIQVPNNPFLMFFWYGAFLENNCQSGVKWPPLSKWFNFTNFQKWLHMHNFSIKQCVFAIFCTILTIRIVEIAYFLKILYILP